MGVVVDLDPLRHIRQLEDFLHFQQQAFLAGRFRQLAGERFGGVALGLGEKVTLGAAFGAPQFDFPPGFQAEGVCDQVSLFGQFVDEDQARRRALVVELDEEGGEHFFRTLITFVARKVDRGAPVLAGADEEDLHAGDAAIHRDGENIGLLDAVRVHILRRADMRERADAVAQASCVFELHRLGGGFHFGGEAFLQIGALPPQEIGGFVGKLGIVFFRNEPDAGRGTALDLVQHAGARAGGVDAVLAGAQQEGLLQRVEGAHHGAGAGEGAEIVALILLAAAILLDLRRLVVPADQDVREGLVVAQKHVEARLQRFDEARLEQQRLGLAFGDDEFHTPGLRDHPGDALGMAAEPDITGDPRLQVAGLADIQDLVGISEHAVDAGL